MVGDARSESANEHAQPATLPFPPTTHEDVTRAVQEITCADCRTKRSNPRFKNTRYCRACRLLRDLIYVAAEQRPCADCARPFAPTDRKDTLCGACHYGSVYEGHCAICLTDAELHRPDIAVCIRCVRDPAKRKTIIAGLRRGQAERKEAHHAA